MSGEEEKRVLNDFSAEVKASVPLWLEPVRKNPSAETLQVALGNLLRLEKKTRLASDIDSTLELTKTIVSLCRELNEWKTLEEHITLLCKRRAQVPKVIQAMIQQAYAMIEETPNEEVKCSLIKTLRAVSDGKIYVELERARMTRMLANMEEKAGRVQEACTLLQETQAETIGSMEIKEKAELILEQIRLCLAVKDFIRAEIIMGKVTSKVLDNVDLQSLKLQFYNLAIQFYMNSNRYKDACKAYLHMFNTPLVQEDEKQWRPVLEKATLLCVLSPHDSEINDIMGRLTVEKKLERLPIYKNLLHEFVLTELMAWPLTNAEDFKQDEIFTDMEQGDVRWQDLRKRSIQHNLRVLAAYYTNLTYDRAAQLLNLSTQELEESLSHLVSEKKLFGKIDRPAGIISFAKKKTSTEELNAWASDIDSFLSLVEDTCHMIHRENMVHGITS
jgi:26S proteasome regulatory subunit N5